MAPVVLEVVLFFPVIACTDIQNILTGDSRIPGLSLQRSGRACFDTQGAAAAKVTLYRLSTGEGHVNKNGPQAGSGGRSSPILLS
jgi:hypothetical protein